MPECRASYQESDFDEQFPKNEKSQVEELEFNLRQDFVFKRRLVNT